MQIFSVSLLAGVALFGVVSAGAAADLIIDTPDVPYTQPADGDWQGAYIGVFGAYAKGEAVAPITFDIKGYLVGVNAGFDFELGNGLVVGVVGDVAKSNITDDDVFLRPSAFDVDWTGSVRGRVGYDAGAFLPYLTAGLALGQSTVTAFDGNEIGSETHVGWTAGGGLEIKATDALSVDVAYRYSDYGSVVYGNTDWSFTTHQVTAGLNWRF